MKIHYSMLFFFTIICLSQSACSQSNEIGANDAPLVTKGLESIKSGFHKEALHYFEMAVNSNENNSKAHYYVGRMHEILTPDNYADEILAFRRVLELEPKHSGATSRLGNALSRSGNRQEARSVYHATLENGPVNPASIYNNIAFTYLLDGDDGQAMRYYLKANEVDNRNTNAINGLALLIASTGDYDKADEMLTRSQNIDGSFSNRGALATRAKVEQLKGDYKSAIANWRRFLTYPQLPSQDMNEATTYIKQLEALIKSNK